MTISPPEREAKAKVTVDTNPVPTSFEKWGKPLIEDCKLGDWFLMKCETINSIEKLRVIRWKKLGPKDFQ